MLSVNSKKKWTLTHSYQSRGAENLPITVIFLTCNECLKEVRHQVTGHIVQNQIIALFDCDYTKPDRW